LILEQRPHRNAWLDTERLPFKGERGARDARGIFSIRYQVVGTCSSSSKRCTFRVLVAIVVVVAVAAVVAVVVAVVAAAVVFPLCHCATKVVRRGTIYHEKQKR
jgi:hypothetical protein